MAFKTEDVRLGTCKILFNGVDLGLTIGGVDVQVQTTTRETKVDQFGETVTKEVITGRNVMASVPLAETTLELLAQIMPGSELVVDGVDPTSKKVVVSTGTGIDLRSSALELVLHPIEKLDADASEDFVIPLAATPGGIEFAYKNDQERVYKADFKGYPDNDGVLFIYGDKSATA